MTQVKGRIYKKVFRILEKPEEYNLLNSSNVSFDATQNW